MIVVADTSGIIAASDRRAPESGACREVLGGAGTVIVSPFVLAEVDHVAKARFGSRARHAICDSIIGQVLRMRFQVPEVSPDALKLAREVQRKYAGLDLDLADAVNVTLAADYRTDAILTLDRRDFRAIRPLTPHKAFRVLPDDL
ncbi:MAG TPA: PIN domain-containing protein [Streptosporangiaceae bacterium]|nr:PIN domain-containing protein [Streptosporangiaceae bacterium]